MKGIDTLPPGPTVEDYDFTLVYYLTPRGGKFRKVIEERLRGGYTPLMAVQGLPVSVEQAKFIKKKLGLTRKDYNWILTPKGKEQVSVYDIVEMYVNQQMSMTDIAAKIRTSYTTIVRTLREMKVQPRKRGWSTKQKEVVTAIIRRVNEEKLCQTSRRRINQWYKRNPKHVEAYKYSQTGMSLKDAAKKAGLTARAASETITKARNRYGIFHDWGLKRPFFFRITDTRFDQWERVAKKEGINVLDWIFKHLNAIADKNDDQYARDRRPKHKRSASRTPVVHEIADTGGESAPVCAGIRPVHERSEASDAGANCQGTENGANCADQVCAEQGLGTVAAPTAVNCQHGSK